MNNGSRPVMKVWSALATIRRYVSPSSMPHLHAGVRVVTRACVRTGRGAGQSLSYRSALGKDAHQ